MEILELFRGKVKYASQTDSSRRVLLVGGSNVIYGHRSQILERGLRIPTTNLGIQNEAGGSAILRDLVLEVVRSGDLVIYSTVSFWGHGKIDQNESLVLAAGLHPEPTSFFGNLWGTFLSHWLPLPRTNSLARALVKSYHKHTRQIPLVFSPKDLTESGDIKACEKADFAPHPIFPPPNTGVFLENLQAFKQRLTRRGATLVIDLPWINIRESDRANWMVQYNGLFDAIRREHIVATQGLEETLISDEALFCDNPIHTNQTAAGAHSRALLNFLIPLIGRTQLHSR